MRQCPHGARVYKLAQLLYQISSRGDVVNVGLYNVHHGIVTYRIISVNTHRKRTDYVDILALITMILSTCWLNANSLLHNSQSMF